MSLAHPTQWRQRHYNKNGLLLWASGLGELAHEGIHRATDEEIDAILAQKWSPNSVTDEGEKLILELAFRNNLAVGGGSLTGWEIALSTDAALTETDTYATRAEHTDTAGYAAIAVARSTGGWTAAAGTTASITTPAAGTHQFAATGTWTAVEACMILSVGMTTNTLVAWDNLSASRSLVNGDTLDVDFDITAEAV